MYVRRSRYSEKGFYIALGARLAWFWVGVKILTPRGCELFKHAHHVCEGVVGALLGEVELEERAQLVALGGEDGALEFSELCEQAPFVVGHDCWSRVTTSV